VRCTWNQFSISTPGDTIYQHLKLNGKFARWDASTQKVLLRAARPGDDDMTGNWAFFGNPYSGFLVVNAAEPDLYLTGKAGNKEYAYLAVGGTRFSVRGSDHQGGGFLMQVGQSVAYLNDFANEGKLATWANANAVSGAGSAFSATLVGETTGIETIENRQLTIANEHWYTISGMKLNGKPTTKGIYIYNGKKVVIK
jgi:hypothetical protein